MAAKILQQSLAVAQSKGMYKIALEKALDKLSRWDRLSFFWWQAVQAAGEALSWIRLGLVVVALYRSKSETRRTK